MIRARYMEVRSRKLPGQPTETIIRTVNAVNGHARKTVRVLRGNRTISHVTEPLTTTERSNIQIRPAARRAAGHSSLLYKEVRRFTPNLYASADAKTLKKANPSSPRKTRKTKRKTRRN